MDWSFYRPDQFFRGHHPDRSHFVSPHRNSPAIFYHGSETSHRTRAYLAQLPPIDLVLLSHAHFDHIDRRTLKLFPESTRVVAASRTRDLLRGTKFCEVIELGWNESVLLKPRGRALEIRAFQPKHWGARLQ